MKHLLTLTFCFILFSSSKAQTDAGIITYKLGSDTINIQYFEYNNHKYKTTILQLTGVISRIEATGELDASGDIIRAESKTYRFDSTGKWFLASDGIYIHTGDSSIYTSYNNGKVILRRAAPSKGIVANGDLAIFLMFPYMTYYAPKKIGDTIRHCHLVFSQCRPFDVSRQKKNELNVGSGVMGRIKLFVDNNDRMTGADAIGSSLNFVATVNRDKRDHVSFIDQFAQRRQLINLVAPRMLRDTARLVVNDIKIEVDHWKPLRRGREIFGSVVPWNRWWRLGANNATQLRTTHALRFENKTIPPGKYSLWALPTQTGWTLMINSKADVWGTEYDPSADLHKEKFTVEKVNTPVDVFRITLHDQGNRRVRMLVEWEYYKAWVDFMVD